jgi:hypothetical protein
VHEKAPCFQLTFLNAGTKIRSETLVVTTLS